jgi:hypothetical protein
MACLRWLFPPHQRFGAEFGWRICAESETKRWEREHLDENNFVENVY